MIIAFSAMKSMNKMWAEYLKNALLLVVLAPSIIIPSASFRLEHVAH